MKEKGILIENEVLAEILEKETEKKYAKNHEIEKEKIPESQKFSSSSEEKMKVIRKKELHGISDQKIYKESSGSSYYRLKVITDRSNSPKMEKKSLSPIIVDLAENIPIKKTVNFLSSAKNLANSKDQNNKKSAKNHDSLSNLIKESFHEYKELNKESNSSNLRKEKRRIRSTRNKRTDNLEIPNPPRNSIINSREELEPVIPEKLKKKKLVSKNRSNFKPKFQNPNPSLKKLVNGIKNKIENTSISSQSFNNFYESKRLNKISNRNQSEETPKSQRGSLRKKKKSNSSKKSTKRNSVGKNKKSDFSVKQRPNHYVVKSKIVVKKKKVEKFIHIENFDLAPPCNTPQDIEVGEKREIAMKPKYQNRMRKESREYKKTEKTTIIKENQVKRINKTPPKIGKRKEKKIENKIISLVIIPPLKIEIQTFSFLRENYVILVNIEPEILEISEFRYDRPKSLIQTKYSNILIEELTLLKLIPIFPETLEIDFLEIKRFYKKLAIIPITGCLREEEGFKLSMILDRVVIPPNLKIQDEFSYQEKQKIEKVKSISCTEESFTLCKKIPIIGVNPRILEKDDNEILIPQITNPISTQILENDEFALNKKIEQIAIHPVLAEEENYYHCRIYKFDNYNPEIIEIDELTHFPVQKRPVVDQIMREYENFEYSTVLKNIAIYPETLLKEDFNFKSQEEILEENKSTVAKVWGSFLKWSPISKIVEDITKKPEEVKEEKKETLKKPDREYIYKADSVLSDYTDSEEEESVTDSGFDTTEQENSSKYNSKKKDFATPENDGEFKEMIKKRNDMRTPSIIISNYAVNEIPNTEDFGLSPSPEKDIIQKKKESTYLKSSQYSVHAIKTQEFQQDSSKVSHLSTRPKIPKLDMRNSNKSNQSNLEKRKSIRELSVILMEPEIHPKYTPRKSRINFSAGIDIQNFAGGLIDSHRSKLSKMSMSVGSLHYGGVRSSRGSEIDIGDLEIIKSEMGGSMSLIDDNELEGFGLGGDSEGDSFTDGQSLGRFKFHEETVESKRSSKRGSERGGEKEGEKELNKDESMDKEIGNNEGKDIDDHVEEKNEIVGNFEGNVHDYEPTTDISDIKLSRLEIKTEIRNSYLMSTDSKPSLNHLLSVVKVQTLKQGDILVSNDTLKLKSLHLVYDGKLKMTKSNGTEIEYLRGDLIGVIECINRNDEKMTIEVLEDDTILISVDWNDLGNAYLKLLKKKVQIGLQLLGLFDLTSDLEDEIKMILMNRVKLEGFNANEWIIREGDYADYLFFLFNGTAEAFKKTEDDPDGDTMMIKVYEEGTWFGEIAIVKGTKRTASVRAVSDCNLLALKAEIVLRFEDLFKGIFESQFYMYD